MLKKIVALTVAVTLLGTMSPIGFAESKRTKLEAELKTKQAKLKETKGQISKLESKISSFDDNIAKHSSQLKEEQKLLDSQKDYFKRLMVRIYSNYDNDLLAKLFSAQSFSQFLSRLQIVGIILKEERGALTKYIEAKNAVEKRIQEIKKEREHQKPLLDKANQEIKTIQKELTGLLSQLEKLNVEDGVYKYYDGDFGTGQFCNPCPGGKLKNNFMEWRGGYHHKGIDICRPIGSPILAADSGVVTKMKSNPGGYGYYIVISHGKGISTLYGHMWRSTVTVSLGQHVSKGQMIARVGMNGDTSGPHLHFEVLQNGSHVNPMKYLV